MTGWLRKPSRRGMAESQRAWRPGPCDFCGQPSAVGDVLCDSCRTEYDGDRAPRASHAERGLK